MANCRACGGSIPEGAKSCPICGAAVKSILPPLDPEGTFVQVERRRMESFPPLFSEEEQKKRAAGRARAPKRAEPPKHASETEKKSGGGRKRPAILIALIVLIIGAAAAAAIYLMLPELRSADEAPVLYVSGGTVYMLRGSEKDDVCTVFDIPGEVSPAKTGFGSEEEMDRALLEEMEYDPSTETLCFTDLIGGLYRVKLNRLGFGKKDIRDRVEQLCSDLCTGGSEECMVTSFLADDGGLFYIRRKERQLVRCGGGKEKTVLAEGVRAFALSENGRSVLYLTGNGENGGGSSMYVLSLETDGKLVKIDSKVHEVRKLDSTFELIWYTQYEPRNTDGPYSVWIGGRNMDKERVMDGLRDCGGFTGDGFYYAVSGDAEVSVWNYVEDVPEDDGDYEYYATLRSVLMRTTVERENLTVGWWQDGNARSVRENVISWTVPEDCEGTAIIEYMDYESLPKLDIREIKNAVTARESVESAEAQTASCFCRGTAIFDLGALRYCTADGESGRLWLTDDSDGRSVLYECSMADPYRRTKIASDVWAAGFDDEKLYLARDYNENTLKCDLYVYNESETKNIAYDVYLPEREIALCADGGAAFRASPQANPGGVTAKLLLWNGTEISETAQQVRDFICISSYRIFCIEKGGVLAAYGPEREEIADKVTGAAAPGCENTLRLSIAPRRTAAEEVKVD